MWITYPGDAEIWLGNAFNNRRTERGAMFPPFWKQDSHYVTVEFSRHVCLDKAETITIECEGRYNFALDGRLRYGEPQEYVIPEGEHTINIKVWNQSTPPSLRVTGRTIVSDRRWLATYEDKMWIDERGVAHGSGIYVAAEEWDDSVVEGRSPSQFRLATRREVAVSSEMRDGGTLYDFGRETMGYIVVSGVKPGTPCHIYYGESPEEALDHDRCETLDHLCAQSCELRAAEAKAFRYVHVVSESRPESVAMLYEYLPQDESRSGAFTCSDTELNNIWQVSARTLDLTTREFFMDGIKRDRWTWSGDAVQSYLMNYYLRFDLATTRRTIRQLRGKDPVTAHVNTIMDYTFYWFQSVLDYYQYTADTAFVREMYPRMRTLMDYVLSRTNAEGFADGRDDDWIFVDWVDFPMHKRGVLAFEQILLAKALETMAMSAELLRDTPYADAPQGSLTCEQYAADAATYRRLFAALRSATDRAFWDEQSHAYLHATEDGVLNPQVTKFPSMMALLFGYATPQRRDEILRHVLLNADIPRITTPYMRFYELDALCEMGQHEYVLREMKAYWGGMLREGATSFWEKYVPSERGKEHLAMYGRPYGKSLCHAWGASPLYLIGKHFIGIRPTQPGYREWECRPHLAGLKSISGAVPTPYGPIRLAIDSEHVEIQSPIGGGHLYLDGRSIDIDTTDKIIIPR